MVTGTVVIRAMVAKLEFMEPIDGVQVGYYETETESPSSTNRDPGRAAVTIMIQVTHCQAVAA